MTVSVASPHWIAISVRASELLADGEWHDYEQVREEIMPLIPAGPAHRRNEDDRLRQSRRLHPDGQRRRVQKPDDITIMFGQKALAREFLNSRIYFKKRVRSGIKQIRMVRVPTEAIKHAEREAYAEAEQRQCNGKRRRASS